LVKVSILQKRFRGNLYILKEFLDKTEAIKREKFLKLQRNKDFYIKLIENFKEP
jgi:predicted GIY-YIG superfamily endonuclease